MKIRNEKQTEGRASFGNLVHALYESLPRKIRNTRKGTALVYLALLDMRDRKLLPGSMRLAI